MSYARRFADVFWFITDLIDDCTTVNDGKEFERGCKEIYSPKLEPKTVSIFYSGRSIFLIRETCL